MIDIFTEDILTLNSAAAELPRRRKRSRPHVATLYRWAQRGLGGFRLETIQVGGTRCTSLEALTRFFCQLNKTSTPSTPSRLRRKTMDAAEKMCVDKGL